MQMARVTKPHERTFAKASGQLCQRRFQSLFAAGAVLNFVRAFSPKMSRRVRLYTGKKPIFDEFGVTAVFSGHDELIEMSETRGDPQQGGNPDHTIRYFVPGTVGDGIRNLSTSLLNDKAVFSYRHSPLGQNYGFLDVGYVGASSMPSTIE